MNRRNFLKSFTAAVTGLVLTTRVGLPATPLAKTVAVVTDEARKAARFYEIEIDRFNVLRFHRVQLEFRRKSLEAKGYVLEGNRFVYRPKFDWYDDWQDDGE